MDSLKSMFFRSGDATRPKVRLRRLLCIVLVFLFSFFFFFLLSLFLMQLFALCVSCRRSSGWAWAD